MLLVYVQFMVADLFASKLSDLSRQVIHSHRYFLYLDLCNHASSLNVFLTESLDESSVSTTQTRFTSFSKWVNFCVSCVSCLFTGQCFADYSS